VQGFGDRWAVCAQRKTDPKSLLACAPNAQIVRFPEIGHFPDLEQPANYATLLVAHVRASQPCGVQAPSDPGR
jgi:pimeloyl-ACP methyl ester carboxylesterase